MRAIRFALLMAGLVAAATAAAADTGYRPFVLASVTDTSLAEQTEATIAALQGAGFELVGRHDPLSNATVLVVTSPELKRIAAASARGGYAAGQRIGITQREGGTEVAFVNPVYIQHAYRLEGDMQPVLDRLGEALGMLEAYGSEKGLSAKKLAKYHYMIGMQRFDDPSELGEFASYEDALAAVESGLARPDDGLTRVYRIDLPGKQQTVFGVAMQGSGENEDIDEAHQLAIVDFEGWSKVAYFPYEILVDGNRAEALHMRFRMAVHFPDLSMMGAHGFTKLMASPGATEDAFEALLQSE